MVLKPNNREYPYDPHAMEPKADQSSHAANPPMASSPILGQPATPCPDTSKVDSDHKARVAKRLKLMEEAMEDHEKHVKAELETLKEGFEELERRRQLDATRAAVRHEILFEALKRIHEEVSKLKHDDSGPPAGGAASPQPTGKKLQEGRKNMERCLEQYTLDMENATKPEQVRAAGKLCTKYSDSLFKTYI